jgi:hypothetical protein
VAYSVVDPERPARPAAHNDSEGRRLADLHGLICRLVRGRLRAEASDEQKEVEEVSSWSILHGGTDVLQERWIAVENSWPLRASELAPLEGCFGLLIGGPRTHALNDSRQVIRDAGRVHEAQTVVPATVANRNCGVHRLVVDQVA